MLAGHGGVLELEVVLYFIRFTEWGRKGGRLIKTFLGLRDWARDGYLGFRVVMGW